MSAPFVALGSALQPAWQALKGLAVVAHREPKISLGLDIGSSSIKVVALGPRQAVGGKRLLTHHLVELSTTAGADPGEVVSQALKAMRLPIKTVTVSVSGQAVIMRLLDMPSMTPHELAQALPFEAQRSLPFNVQDVMLDGAVLGRANGNRVWVLMAACKRDVVERRVEWVRRGGYEPVVMDIDALALANAFLEQANGRTPLESSGLINLGAQWTHLVVLKGAIPYLVRDIPWGADKFAQQVGERVGLAPPEVASQLGSPAAAQEPWVGAMKSACESLVEEVQMSFDFFESHFGPPPTRLLVSGGLGQSAAVLDALKSHLAQSLVPWAPAEGLSGRFAVAYGLALRSG